MTQTMDLYEKKILKDKDFPIQMFIDVRNSRGYCFAPHWHEHLELHYVVDGETVIRLEQKELLARKGDLVIANSNILHEGICLDHMETMVVIFAMEDFSRELVDKNVIFESLVSNDQEIGRIMMSIYGEYKRRETGYRLVCKGKLLELLAYLVRHYALEVLSEQDGARRREKLERLNIVYQYIENHYTEPINNGQLADLIHISEGRFNHIFKESTGMAPLQYINETRLKKAMNLLKSGGFTTTEVAGAVGFSDYNHFGRLFRRRFGCSPLEARENSRIV